MMGLLESLDDPKMAMAMGLLSAAGPSMRPIGVGQALGMGMNEMQQQRMLNDKRKQMEMHQKMQQMQMEELQRQQQLQTQQRGYIDNVIAGMPSEQQNLFRAYPQLIPELMKPKEKFDKVNPKDFTPESVAQFSKSGSYADLVPIEKPESVPSAVKEYKFAQQQGFKGTFEQWDTARRQAGASVVNNYPNPIAVTKPDGSTAMVQFGSKGAVVETPYKPEPKEPKAPTEAENKSSIYYKQMNAAEKTIAQLEKEGLDMSRLWSQAETGVAGTLAGNMVASPRAQQARQAQNQWAEQMLRQQTGAAATEQEVQRTVKTYFPQPGDSKETVDLKRRMRANAMEAVGSAAGRAIKPVDVKGGSPDLPSAVQKFETLPPANQYKGRRMKGPDGIYRSNGMSWVKE